PDVAVGDVQRARESGGGANLEAVAIDQAVVGWRPDVAHRLRAGEHHVGREIVDRAGRDSGVIDEHSDGEARDKAPSRGDLRPDHVGAGGEVVHRYREEAVVGATAGERAGGLAVQQEVDGKRIGIARIGIERVGKNADGSRRGEVHAGRGTLDYDVRAIE